MADPTEGLFKFSQDADYCTNREKALGEIRRKCEELWGGSAVAAFAVEKAISLSKHPTESTSRGSGKTRGIDLALRWMAEQKLDTRAEWSELAFSLHKLRVSETSV